jgi:GntR family transcriptional regulator
VIEFYLDSKSGVSPYLQLVHQVRRALKLGTLREGDQLPTVREVVASIAINPNTVFKVRHGNDQRRPARSTRAVPP